MQPVRSTLARLNASPRRSNTAEDTVTPALKPVGAALARYQPVPVRLSNMPPSWWSTNVQPVPIQSQ